MPTTDLIVAALWVGGLSLFLLGQAFAGWLRLRYARRSVRHASRLFEATRTVAVRRSPTPHIRRAQHGQSDLTGAAPEMEATSLPTR